MEPRATLGWVGCVLPHRLCPAGSARSGARLQTPALRGDQPGPGANPGLQSGAKGETGPLRGPEESTQETEPREARSGCRPELRWAPAGLQGRAARERPHCGLLACSGTDRCPFGSCEKSGSVKEGKTFKCLPR